MSTTATSNSDRWKAFAGTLIFHGLILLVFFLIVFQNPDPPLFSDNSGVEVNFGFSEDGTGDIQPEPDKDLIKTTPQQQQKEKERVEEKDILTQDLEDAPEIAKKEVKKEVKKTPVVVTPPKKEVPKPPVVNANALYKPKKNGGEGETGKPGDQGIEEGSVYSKTHGTQNGSGDHGDGTGSHGNGGPGGNGYDFSLAGRNMRVAPKITDQSQEQGKVVVDITVDKNGNVVTASAPGRGSTTTSSNLVRKAKDSAMKTKFSPSAQGVEEQRGTITFVFILR
ncbi:MAG: TonB family protein [Bacteroidota bacterium]